VTSIEERAADIRRWTKPSNPVPLAVVVRYAKAAAIWERMRWRLYKSTPTPADDERFAALSGVLRDQLREMGYQIKDVGEPEPAQLRRSDLRQQNLRREHAVTGITSDGFLPGDPARLLDGDWRDQAELMWGKR
jgi:hypothetical protein